MSTDKLISYFNNHTGADYNIELMYSTPSMYIDALANDSVEFVTKYDDMFPYADSEDSYWTGYFSSRANDKSYDRLGSHAFHSSNKLFALASLDETTSNSTVEAMLESKAKL